MDARHWKPNCPAYSAGWQCRKALDELAAVLTDPQRPLSPPPKPWEPGQRQRGVGTIAAVRRVLLNVVTVVSLLLCVSAATVWVRSYRRTWRTEWIGRDRSGSLFIAAGRVRVIYAADVSAVDTPGWSTSAGDLRTGPPKWSRPGPGPWGFAFHYTHTVGAPRGGWMRGGRPLYVVWLPGWAPALAAALPPMLWGAVGLREGLRKRRRVRQEACPSCGYDLRGNVGGVCPECGRAT